jgi:hypothetical protein
MSAHYNLQSTWQLDAPTPQVWRALTHPRSWQAWWPGLIEVLSSSDGEAIGQAIQLTFKAQGGYQLHLTLTVTELREPQLIAFDSSGDLIGRGKWELSSIGKTTKILISWQVAVTRPWMVRFSPVLRPFFILSHARLMKVGERGLQQHLRV